MLAVFGTGLAIWPFHQEGFLVYHKYVGWALAGWGVVALVRPKAVGRFFAEIARFTRQDLRWLAVAPLTIPGFKPFPRQEGHLDPGQRVMGWAIIVLAIIGTVSGSLIIFSCSPACGQVYLVSFYAHRASIAMLGFVLIAHVVVSVGLPKPYRGVWHAMHGNGRVPTDVAHRLWPAWAERKAR